MISRGELSDRIGIQGYCFRALEAPGGLIGALGECGADRLEMWGGHLDPSRDPGWAEALDHYRKRGITISSYGVHRFDGDEAGARPVFEFARRAGFPVISADLAPGGLETAEALCREYGRKIAVHNHGRKHPLGSVAALEELFAASSANIGLCLDTAWMLDSGEDPLAVARRFRSRLYGLHLKDFVFDRAGRPADVIIGTGNLDLPSLAGYLAESDFDGYLTLEYEGDSEDPVPPIRECLEAVRAAFLA